MAQTILITGTSSGIGAATATLFAERGWNVVATMRNLDPDSFGDRENVLRFQLDVTDKVSIDRAFAAAAERFGQIDAIVNNAGCGEFGVLEAIDDAKVRANFDVNVFGVINVIRAALPQFRARRRGLIVNVSSGGGIIGLPAAGVYLATKFALEGLSESIWYELDALGISLKLVEPGGVTTPFLTKIAAQRATNQPPADYAPFVEKTNARMAELGWERSSPEEIAEVIWTSVTDGSRRLRYFHGPGIQHLVDGRHRSADPEYEALVRREFALSPD